MSATPIRRRLALVTFLAGLVVSLPAFAVTTLSIAAPPINWNVVGLDSNTPATGPHLFPVGTRVCSSVATTNVSVNFVFDSANPFVNLRAGSLSTVVIPSIGAGQCKDAYFEVDITQTAAAFDTTRRFHITATDVSGTVSTPVPRELYVEHLISQNRNSVTDVKFGPAGCGGTNTCTSVAPGGSMNLVVGNTYDIQLLGGTATQGYNQFEAFINFPNTIFQILGVTTTYSADNSPFVPNPNDKLYADACLWQNDPNSPAYRSCVGGDFKAGGNSVVTTYTIKIVSGGGTSQPLNTLLYDFSGSSYHYNADFAVGARIANVIDPTAAGITKSFSPNPTSLNGISALKITLTNPNAAPVGGYNFVDNLPANLIVATPPTASTSGCGAPTLTAVAGSSSISFSNGTVAANGSCVISVNVTPTATGSLINTTNHLFIDANDTGKFGSATLTVNNAPPPGTGICGLSLATWTFPTGFNISAPAASTSTVSTSAAIGAGLTAQQTAESTITNTAGSSSWGTNGATATGATLTTSNDDYFEFAINTTGKTSVAFSFQARRTNNGAQGLAVFVGTTNTRPETGTSVFSNSAALTAAGTAWTAFGPFTVNSGLNPAGLTYFRVYGFNSGNTNPGADLSLDNVVFTGCAAAINPTIAKSFTPNPIAVNGVSTLTFTLTNANTTQLTGATFTDALPSGLQVAPVPSASTTCTGGPTWAPAAAATTLTFGSPAGANIPASGSCTVSVNVTATTAGPHTNTSGFLSTTESGTNTTSVATAPLTAVLPPSIAKAFAPTPILAGGISRLTFTITNPNPNDAIGGVAFADTFPIAPGLMKVVGTPNASTSGCGAPVFAPVANAGSINFSGGTIAPGGTCTVGLDITAPVNGTYNNTSGNVSHIINAQTVNGNTASASLVVNPPHPSIGLLKQVATTAGGPWQSFVAVPSGSVFYRFTVENTGDVPLTLGPATITDNTLNVSTCNAGFNGSILPVAVAANDNHIVSCVVGPVPVTNGSHTNTAHATGTFSGNPVDSPNSSATYATTGLTLVKSAAETSFNNAGDALHYSYLVTNSGAAPLAGPVTVADNKTTVTCPPVNTVGDLDNFLDPGESVTCTATYTITGGDVAALFVTNTATATADGVNSNQSSKTVSLSTAADVSIVKTLLTAGPFTPGQTVSYTLFVANAGPATATNIQVTDTPTNLTITSVSGGGCAALPCTIPSLAAGANATINVDATITAAGLFDNSANATATQPDPNTGNNTDSTGNGGSTGASADVSLVKTLLTSGPFVIGQSVSYSLFIANAGPSTATNIQVTDTPSNLTITSVTGSGCAALPCTIPSLASGANTTINVTATINAVGAFDNTANATATEFDPNTGNNTDSVGNGGTAAASADVRLTKTLTTSGPFTIGQPVTYTLFVENLGPSTATNIQVTDTPTNLTITNVTGGGCAALPCTIATLASGANTTITVTATITAAGAFDNTANATAVESDPVAANNTDSTGNGGTAAASADVSLVKTLVTTGPFVIGQQITYTLFVANAGPSPATSILVTDTPLNLTITNVTGGGCAALPCTLGSLASGANATITVTATINAVGAFDNSANATAVEPDPNTTNNTDSTLNGGTAVASADVSLVKTLVTSGPFTIGQAISYTLDVHNAGPSTATNIQVTDTPSNLTITLVSGSGCAALPCTIPSLASGATTTVNVTATINASGAFDNTANATAAESDPNTGNNTDSTGNGGTAGASVDVSLVKTLVTTGPFTIGETINYTLDVHNAGPSTATNIQVTDTPTNLTITIVSGSGCAALPCTIPTLAPGATTTINVTATINATGAFDNTATATPAEPDSNTADNTDSTGNGGTAVASADVSLSKTLDTAGPFIVGQTISYTIVVANAGPSTATNIQVTDLPTGLSITSVSGSGCAALPCTIPSLLSGANTTINVTAVITAQSFNNSATATATESDPNTNDNTDNSGNGGEADPSADVSLVKTLTTAGPFSVGQTITYTLDVANAGPSTATAIQVTDTPSNLTITNVTGSGCAALPCTIASLASGATTTITVTATINAAGVFDNSATATPFESDPNTSNNTDNTLNGGTTAASADVSLVKTLVTAGPFTVGQTISYTLLIANAGTSTATSIQVTDTPSNLTITNVTGSGCAALPCTIASLASGANTSITVTATINAVGVFDNSATATAAEFDPNTTNNTDNTGNGGTTGPSANVSLVKTLGTAGPFVAGQTISYTLVVANAGPSTATNIQVTDTPSNLTITNVSGSGCAALPCTIASLSSGANTTINVSAKIIAAGAFNNSATATAAEFDPNTTDNTDNTGNGGAASPSADVSIVKTLVTTGPYYAGQSVSYTLLVANAGPSTATNIVVTDTPVNQTITSVSGSGCVALPCTIPSLAVGANTTINVTATIIAAGIFTNSATATPAEFDPNMLDNTGNAGNGGLALASADVSLVKTLITAGPFSAGQSISYTLVVANAGPSTATNIQVTDTPTNLTITSVTGSGCAALPCTIASLAMGANTTINVTATITAAGAFDNSATATPAEFDPNTTNNTDSTGNGGTTGVASADMRITKTASIPAASVGQTFDYTLAVVNNGPSTATGVVVADTIPSGFNLISATSTQGSCSGTATVTCTVGTMVNGATVTITLHGTALAGGSLANTATVSANETDPLPGNNTSTVNLQFVAGGPTLSTIGLIIMAMLLAIAGAMVMKAGE
ncbi:MAG: hypothetical protein QOC81_1972 [Thermoanaerobaculia bacterium]|jgi:uncharacterized repeat protein (TIGR01451 family)|nr:hypothetical protein [Thermoanaerobaculia bacterium]